MSGITWTEPALDDVKALRAWIGRDSKPLSDRMVAKIFDAVEQAIPFPRIGRVVREVGDDTVRELILRTFRIVYRVQEEGIVVLGILHGGRSGERREPRRWEIF